MELPPGMTTELFHRRSFDRISNQYDVEFDGGLHQRVADGDPVVWCRAPVGDHHQRSTSWMVDHRIPALSQCLTKIGSTSRCDLRGDPLEP
jgi:hypothetical protein